MDERWITILSYWQNHELRHSLSFPFLIGALRSPVGSKSTEMNARNELAMLIDTMRSHRADDCYYNIYRCPDLAQLVIRKVSNSVPPASAIAIASSKPSVSPSLFVSEVLQLEGATPYEALVDLIWGEVGMAIESGNFSCHGKVLGEFSEYDLRVINNALA